ncbi:MULTISPECIES: RNA-guided pseudouridylation complex pseudouridine synthase subunit Cbf5 [Methanobacterium]|uniref:Probable tRNA pseudouridine synthase B n=1 Tax=Methanobacterium bryantii TaxID=2161 RepID=A0A2A2H254_METBR|nr:MULTISPECIES: RNA-guided pseudouridylation complex pseudouridine synthase subunit Cbf5 [Methanobacterium]OEC88044.1 tRNA pseudouridine(55) synthase TruB [Methanobacterium sp. A39]PAV03445.1 H/ACA RNA-protein complex component Cbf5p [Methanobacterium bryantii]
MADLLIKAEGETDPDYGTFPDERPIEDHIKRGIVNLDKPSGPTSHEIDSWVKRILGVEKTGHGGTLDPKVTGVLPIGIDYATRAIQMLLGADKEYVCLMHMHEEISETEIREILKEFQGKIFQTPPLKSAVKREMRVRNIYYVNILEIDGQDVLFKIGCEGGTYIRKYCHDVGEALGIGAHMAELRRTKSGPFTEDETLTTLQDLTDAYHIWKEEGDESFIRDCILPMELAVKHLPKIIIRDSAVDAVCHGADLAAGGIISLDDKIKENDTVAIMTLKGELVAAGESLKTSKEIYKANKGIVIDIKKVFMEPGTYPKMWK